MPIDNTTADPPPARFDAVRRERMADERRRAWIEFCKVGPFTSIAEVCQRADQLLLRYDARFAEGGTGVRPPP